MCPPVPTEGAGLFLRGGWLGYCLNLGLILPSSHLCSSLICQSIVKSLLIYSASSHCIDNTLLFAQSLVLIFPAVSLQERKEAFRRLALQPCVPLVRGVPVAPHSSSASFCVCSPQRPPLPLRTGSSPLAPPLSYLTAWPVRAHASLTLGRCHCPVRTSLRYLLR